VVDRIARLSLSERNALLAFLGTADENELPEQSADASEIDVAETTPEKGRA
jgi:hypothetical protein